jgi:hypothetical protein
VHAIALAVVLSASQVSATHPRPDHRRDWAFGEVSLLGAGIAQTLLGVLWVGSGAGAFSLFNRPSAAEFGGVGWTNLAVGVGAIVGAVVMIACQAQALESPNDQTPHARPVGWTAAEVTVSVLGTALAVFGAQQASFGNGNPVLGWGAVGFGFTAIAAAIGLAVYQSLQ